MRVAFDLDGVMASTDRGLFTAFHGRGLVLDKTPADLTHYYYEEAFPGEITTDLMHEILNEEDFYYNLPAIEPLVKACHLAYGMDCEVHIVTARLGPPHVRRQTEWWLEQNQIPHHHLAIEAARDKVGYMQEHDIDLIVEDKFETAYAAAQAGKTAVLVAAPYNTVGEYGRPSDSPENLYRMPADHVSTWLALHLLLDPVKSVLKQATKGVYYQPTDKPRPRRPAPTSI